LTEQKSLLAWGLLIGKFQIGIQTFFTEQESVLAWGLLISKHVAMAEELGNFGKQLPV
jgi:hypothetical protein